MVLELVLEREIDCQPLKRKTRFGFHFYVIHGTWKEKDYRRNNYHSRLATKMAGLKYWKNIIGKDMQTNCFLRIEK